MLSSLTIENFAIIKKQTLVFKEGLTVLTGQTGAGKSLLIDAVSLCLGGRSDLSMIKVGEDKATLIAVFEIQKQFEETKHLLKEYDIDLDEPQIIIKRVLVKDGASRCYLNDTAVSLATIKTLTFSLMEIHQQFDHLMDAATHRTFLDIYGELNLLPTKETFSKWKELSSQLSKTKEELAQLIREKEFLEQQVQELRAFDPINDEENTLVDKRTQLKQQSGIISSYRTALEELSTAHSCFLNAHKQFCKVEDPNSDKLDALLSEAMDMKSIVEDKLYHLEHETLDTEGIEERLMQLRHLARKYQTSPNSLRSELDKAEHMLMTLSSGVSNLEQLEKEVVAAQKEYLEAANKLSETRKNTAKKLDALVAEELTPLKLSSSLFCTKITDLGEQDWSQSGLNRVEFLVDMNNQGALNPLHKVASGGEMARLMLALKVVLSKNSAVCTFIFDEIDTGIGGDVADAVGKRLQRLSENKQVVVITHSPQVASYGHNHILISKFIEDGETRTSTKELSEDERIKEIARMLSGEHVTQEAIAAAKALLNEHYLK